MVRVVLRNWREDLHDELFFSNCKLEQDEKYRGFVFHLPKVLFSISFNSYTIREVHH